MESSSKEFSLKWNNFFNNLSTGFFSHLNENDLVDVTLAVDGQLITAHKLVLSVCSSYFKSIFKKNPCEHPVIILKDVKQWEMEALLKFMYQGEVNVKQEDLPTFLKVAHMLRIRGLEGSEGKIIPLLNDYINASDTQSESEYATALSDTLSEQESRKQDMDESVSSQEVAKKNVKKNKRQMADNCNNLHKKVKSDSSVNSNDTVYFLSDEENDPKSEKDIKTSDVINNDEKEIIEFTDNLKGNSTQSVVEPVTYRLSNRGRPQLVHDGYVYNLTSRSITLNRSHYRCAEQHRGCRGKCAVIAERFMPTGVHDHNHPPGYQSEYDYRKKKGQDMDSV